MKVGIDLLWVRPGKNGGTESYIRNILDGLSLYAEQNQKYYLYVSKDNYQTFEKYFTNPNFEKRLCDVNTASQRNRIIWENLHLSKMGVKDQLDVWFMPVYSRPFFMSKKVPVITAIHDIQGIHFPEYFSKARNMFFRLSWWWDCKTSDKIVTISKFCKEDILKHYHIPQSKIQVIYNPIITNKTNYNFSKLEERFAIKDKAYYYTVSSLAKHKNLITLLKAMKKLKESGETRKLLITGVKVNAGNEIERFVKENNLQDVVVFTGFISNEERDALYDHCKIFLFPSVFEGFGMPPIEAMRRGRPVITTRETSLYEVTQGKAIYVENPYDENEWKELLQPEEPYDVVYSFEEYSLKLITSQYVSLFSRLLLRGDGK